MQRKSGVILGLGIAAAIAVVACLLVYPELHSKERARLRAYQRALQNPAMAKWLQYFKVDGRTWTHPFKILRIIEHPGSQRFSAETPFAHDFLEQLNWGRQFPTGKFLLVVNGDVIASGCHGATTNGTCLVRFDASELKTGTNQVRIDILVDNPSRTVGWIQAQGPSTELVFTNGLR